MEIIGIGRTRPHLGQAPALGLTGRGQTRDLAKGRLAVSLATASVVKQLMKEKRTTTTHTWGARPGRACQPASGPRSWSTCSRIPSPWCVPSSGAQTAWTASYTWRHDLNQRPSYMPSAQIPRCCAKCWPKNTKCAGTTVPPKSWTPLWNVETTTISSSIRQSPRGS